MTPIELTSACQAGNVVVLGKESCGKFKSLPKGFIFSEEGFAIDVADLIDKDTLIEKLNGLVSFGSTGSERAGQVPAIFPYYPEITNVEPTGGDPKIQTEGFGSGMPNGINPYSETYTIVNGGECLYKQLLRLKGREVRVFKIDDTDTVYGTLAKSNTVVRGYSVRVSVTQRDNNGSNVGAIRLLLTYQNNYEKEREKEVSLIIGEELKTLREISLMPITPDGGTFGEAFKIVTSCGLKSITSGNAGIAAILTTSLPSLMRNKGGLITPAAPTGVTVTYDAVTDSFSVELNAATTPENVKNYSLVQNLFNVTGADVEDLQFFVGNTDYLNITV